MALAPARGLSAQLDRRFLYAGLAFTVLGGSALGMVNLAFLHAALGPVPPTHTQAHAHAQIFGFLGLFIAGFGAHLLPQMSARPLAFPRLARLAFPLMALGALFHLLGQPAARWWPGRVLLGLSALPVALGALAFCVVVWGTTWAVHSPYVFERFVRLGAALLALAGVVDAACALSVALGGGAGGGLYPGFASQPLWHLGVYGEAAFTVGIALRTLPAFSGGGAVRPRPARLAFHLLAAGIPLQALALALLGTAPWTAAFDLAARTVVGLGLVAAALAFPFRAARLALQSAASSSFRFTARFAVACLGAAGLFRLATAALEAAGVEVNSIALDAERHLVTVGFLVALVTAMAPRLLLALGGLPLRLAGLRWPIALLVACGVVLRTLEAAAPLWAPMLYVSAVSGVLVWSALVLLAAMVIATVRRRPAA